MFFLQGYGAVQVENGGWCTNIVQWFNIKFSQSCAEAPILVSNKDQTSINVK